MTAKPFFHHQFYRTYFLLFFTLAIFIFALFGLVKVREHHFDLQINANLPQLEQNQQQLLLLQKAQSNLHELSIAEHAADFIEYHNELETTLQALLSNDKQLTRSNFIYLANKTDAESVIRLAGSNKFNRQLLTKTEESFSQLLEPFKSLIALKNKRAAELLYLIKSDRLSEQATSARALAHAKLITTIADERLAYEQLLQLTVQLPLLNLQSKSEFIENIVQTSNDFFTWFDNSGQSIANENQVLFKNLSALKQVFIVKEKFTLKWQEQLIKYHEYLALIAQQNDYLITLSERINNENNKVTPALSVDDLLPLSIRVALVRAKISLSHQSLMNILLTVISFSLIMFLFIILNMNSRLKIAFSSNQKTNGTIQNNSDKKVNDQTEENILEEEDKTPLEDTAAQDKKPKEQSELLSLASTIGNSNFIEDHAREISHLSQQYKTVMTNIADFHGVVSWTHQDIQSNEAITTVIKPLISLENPFTFSANFTRASFKLLIQSARVAKATGKLVECTLESKLGQKYCCTVNFLEGFYGSLSQIHLNEEIIEIDVIEDLNKLPHSNIDEAFDNIRGMHTLEKTEIAASLTDKVIKAMLQNQAESLTKKVAVSSLYRQLQRILILGQEIALKTQLTNDKFEALPNKVSLQSQIIASLNNVNSEIKSHKNQSQYQDDLPHTCHVKMDAGIYNSAILSIIRLMFAGQRNSQLLLTTCLNEQYEKQHTVHYQFSISIDKAIKEAPIELLVLIDDSLATDGFEQKSLIKIILDYLEATDISISPNENGYAFSFNLPHDGITDSSLDVDTMASNDFSQYSFLYIQNKLSDTAISKGLSETKVNLTVLEDITESLNYLTAERLITNPIDLVLIGSEHEVNQVEANIALLPMNVRPKILTLLDNASLLFTNSQQALPLDKYALFNNIESLLNTNDVNKDINFTCTETYITTGIEVLLAVSLIDKYSALIHMLTVMGFNITYVANESEMLALWKTGRHLILISGFNASPIVELRNGKQVQRGIVGLSETAVAEWQKQAVQKQWQISHLSSSLSFQYLAELFSTWLVEKEKRPTSKKLISPNTITEKEAQPSITSEGLPAAFNLQQFANNQAGPEFAVMMIDEYINENYQLLHKLEYAISVKSHVHIISHLESLIKNSKIMSAEDLLDICQQISAAIEVQDYCSAKSLLPALNNAVELVAQYAEAI